MGRQLSLVPPMLLVILSPSSVSSTNVEDEVAFALEEHKTVIPVFYRDCKVPFQLRPFQYVDFRTDYDRGLKTLLRTLGAEQLPLEQETKQAEQARLEEQARGRKAAEEKARPVLSKKTMAGLGVGVVVLLLVGMMWWRRSHNQTSQPQTAGQQPQSTQQHPQTTEPQTQTVVQQPQNTEPKPKPPATDVKKPVAQSCPEGVYCDPDTNLMWTIKDNGNDITWPQADQYCRSLTLAGLSGWGLPPIDELEKLRDPQNPTNRNIRKPFRLTSYWVWSSTKQVYGSGSAWANDFHDGKGGPLALDLSDDRRALCVRRSGK